MINDYDLCSKETWLVSEDGLWDLCIGFGILGLGLTIALNQSIWFIAFAMLAYFLVVMAGKEVITRPRFYFFNINPEQLTKLAKAINIGLVILILSFVLGALSFLAFDTDVSWLRWFSDSAIIILGGIISAVLIIFGYLGLGGVRFYVYAGLVFLAFVVNQILEFPIVPLLMSTSIFLMVSGVFLLVRFILRYPKPNTQGDVKM
jgi:hypothetical protein